MIIYIILSILLIILLFGLFVFFCLKFNPFFRLWPTNLGDHKLEITSETILKLQKFRDTKKFLPDSKLYYPGAPDEFIRAAEEMLINDLTDKIISEVTQNPKKSFILSLFKKTLIRFDLYNSEEMDRTCFYLQEIMTILGIKSSENLINLWRYGLILTYLPICLHADRN